MSLENIGKYIEEFSRKNKNNEPYPVYSVTNSNGFCTDYFNKDVSGQDKTTYKIVPRGYFAYNPSRINVGSIDWQNIEDNVIVSPLYVIFKCSNNLDQDYLKYFLKSPEGIRLINEKAIGSVRNNLKFKELSEFKLNIVDVKEQRNIVSKLKLIESAIENEKNQIKLYDELIKARFVEMFGNPVANEKGWNVDLCKNLTTKIGSGATPKGGKESYLTKGISLIRSLNVHNNQFVYDDLACISKEQAEKLNNVIIQQGDVLLNITGASVARCCIVPNSVLPARVNQHVSIIRCNEKLLPVFVSCMFTDDNFQQFLLNVATGGGATREAITKEEIEKFVLITPPIERQKQFVDFVEQVDKSKVVAKQRLKLFEELLQKKTYDYYIG